MRYATILTASVLALGFAIEGLESDQVEKSVTKASEKYENLQLLGDLPADQLIPTMMYFRNSLGVGCNYCHVRGARQLDDKREKRIAREMIRMVRSIHDQTPGVTNEVSCATCHKGQTRPSHDVPLARWETAAVEVEEGERTAPTVPDILNRYVDALGGEELLASFRSRVERGRLVSSRGDEASVEFLFEAPDRFLDTRDYGDEKTVTGFDGEVAWRKSGEGPATVRTGVSRWFTEKGADFMLPRNLASHYDRMEVVGLEKLGDRRAWVIEAAPPVDGLTHRLYFDAENGLLLRTLMITPSPFGDNPQAEDLFDYRRVDGVLTPFRITTVTPDFRVDIVLDEVVHDVEIDDDLFRPDRIE